MAVSGNAWRCFRVFTCRHCMMTLWICFVSFVFWTSYSKYKMEPKYYYLRQILGSGLCLSRGMASVLNICCFLVVLPTCRLLTSWIRHFGSQLSIGCVRICIDSSKGFHITCAFTIVIASALHSVAHIVNAQNFSRHYNSRFKHINMAQYKGQDPVMMMIGTVPGITGILMMVILCILCASSMKYVRIACYDMFWICHHLFILFLILLLCHPISGLLKEQNNTIYHMPGCEYINASYKPEIGYPENTYGSPGICSVDPTFVPQNTETWKWVTAALSVYAVDLGWRLLRRRIPIHIVSVQAYKCQLLCLKFLKEGFKAIPGQYVYLNCSAVSSLEWHPFSISMCPTDEDPTFTVHLRTVGDWSGCIREYLYLQIVDQSGSMEVASNEFSLSFPSRSCLDTEFLIDGPFSSCFEDIRHHSICICVAGGIGITPFVSLLNSLRSRKTW